MRRPAVLLVLLSGCALAYQEPAVRGLPRDDREADLSAVWVGHATVLLRLGRHTVIADPNLGGAILEVVPRETPASLHSWELPRIDVALLSHMHFDHFDAKTLRHLGKWPVVLYPKGGEAYEDEILQPRKRALDHWESIEVRGLRITAVPVRHQGGRYGIDALWNHAFTGYIIEGAGRRVFFAGDTGYDPGMFREIGARFPGIDVAFIPIAPGRKDGQADRWGHANPRQALDIFADVGARYMVPIHFESYYTGRGDPKAPRRELVAEVQRRGLEDRVFALHVGERIAFPEGAPLVIRDTGTAPERLAAKP